MGFRKITKQGCYAKELKLVLGSNVSESTFACSAIFKRPRGSHRASQTRSRQEEGEKRKKTCRAAASGCGTQFWRTRVARLSAPVDTSTGTSNALKRPAKKTNRILAISQEAYQAYCGARTRQVPRSYMSVLLREFGKAYRTTNRHLMAGTVAVGLLCKWRLS
jgi:hypothetical protein